MASLNFPTATTDGQLYNLNGAYYAWSNTLNAWTSTYVTSTLTGITTIANNQIIFSDGGVSNGSNGLTFSKSSNTFYTDTIVSSNITVSGMNVYSWINSSFATANTKLSNTNITIAGNLTSTGTFTDSKSADVRDIPLNRQTSPYGLVITDTGKTVSTSSTIFVPAGIFYAGNVICLYNNSSSSITVTQNTNVTLYQVGKATTGNRTLAQRGFASIICVDANTFVISGGGLT